MKRDSFVSESTIYMSERGSSGESEAREIHFGYPMKDIEVVSIHCNAVDRFDRS